MAKPQLGNPVKPISSCTTSKKLLSIMVISAPLLLYISLLHTSPSSLFDDTKFWFLMSNAIILIVAADSGMFATSDGHVDVYQEYMKHGRSSSSECTVREPPRIRWREEEPTTCLALVPLEGTGGDKEEGMNKRRYSRITSELKAPPPNHDAESNTVVLRRSTTEKKRRPSEKEEESEYSAMSDEELNRRVEEFIRRFNKEIRQQQMEDDTVIE